MDFSTLFAKSDLIPVIVQDSATLTVLMLGYANKEALERTIETSTAWFWSRSRNRLWNKGETSGNHLHVERIMVDCDNDTLLLFCCPKGPVCHTGKETCFYRSLLSSTVNKEEA